MEQFAGSLEIQFFHRCAFVRAYGLLLNAQEAGYAGMCFSLLKMMQHFPLTLCEWFVEADFAASPHFFGRRLWGK